MSKTRLEAFSDGVIAIIITIMVLEFKVPEGADWRALRPLAPIFLTYVLSFVYVGIYWNNHHHLFHAAARHGAVLWANLHLLFWLSLDPVRDRLDGRQPPGACRRRSTASCCSWRQSAYWILQQTIMAAAGPDSRWRSRSAATSRACFDRLYASGDRPGVRQPVGVGCDLRGRGADVVGAGPAIKADVAFGVQLQPDVVVHAEQPEDSRDGDLVFREVESRGRLGCHRVAGKAARHVPCLLRRHAVERHLADQLKVRVPEAGSGTGIPFCAAGRTRRADIDSSSACSRGQNRRASVRRS